MDGYDATRAIHALERSADRAPVPVVALTAHVIGEHAQTWRNAGMTGYLTKPYTLQSLRTCIADALGAARLTPPSTTADRPDNDAITGKSDLFDRSVLDNIAEMQEPGDDFVERVVRLYATHAPRSLQTLLAVIPSGNAIAIAEAAHALRSLSRNIGAIRVGDLCTRLEAEARDEDLSNVEAHCAAIQQSMPATIAALTAELARGSGTSELQQAAG
jgi:two-component system sensor histidine kinase BarA